jgi:c-di-GMP-related signal transduction protein
MENHDRRQTRKPRGESACKQSSTWLGLGLVCVAEGVESEDLYVDMVELGFDLLQGYFVAKPLSEKELLEFARTTAVRPRRTAVRAGSGAQHSN